AVLPVGSETEIPVDIRILSASHMDLAQRVSSGLFRQDLLFRLDVIRIDMPVLRERQEDIPELANFFIHKYVAEWGVPDTHLKPAALAALQSYHYPGNVRELENILQRAVTLSEHGEIDVESLSLPHDPSLFDGNAPSEVDLDFPVKSAEPLNSSNSPAEDLEINDLEGYLEQKERDIISRALESTKWNKTAAAEKLGITFRALRYRCKKLGID
ncbi:MAG: helix-turn-helix domain-containing protein, partial [Oceanobacter sp.]